MELERGRCRPNMKRVEDTKIKTMRRTSQQMEKDQLATTTNAKKVVLKEKVLFVSIDSGCRNHMTHDKDLFKDLKPTRVIKVRIAYGGYILTKGLGPLQLKHNQVPQQFLVLFRYNI